MDLQTSSFQPEYTSAANQYWISAFTLLTYGLDGPSRAPLTVVSQNQFSSFYMGSNANQYISNVPVLMQFCVRVEKKRQELLKNLREKMRAKREGNQGSAYGILNYLALANERPQIDLYPWSRVDKYYEQNVRGLTEEIYDFMNYIQPSHEERMVRQRVIDRITGLIEDIWPDCEHTVFGSFKTDLFLPTSDIDLAITGRLPSEPYVVLQRAIECASMASSIKVISTASVPLVKMTDRETQIRVDISFNVANAQESANLISYHLDLNPSLKPLILVLKQFLLQRDLNEVYSGGISSYSLILMCIAFTLNISTRKIHPDMTSPGQMLVEFFEFYGRHFNFTKCTVSINTFNGIMNRREFMKRSKYNPTSYMSIEDPLDSENDIARNSFGASNVRDAFARSYDTLSAAVLSVYNEVHTTIIEVNRSPNFTEPFSSILARILCVTKEMQNYRRWISENFRDGIYYPSIESSVKNQNSHISSGNSAKHPFPVPVVQETDQPALLSLTNSACSVPIGYSDAQSDEIAMSYTGLDTPSSGTQSDVAAPVDGHGDITRGMQRPSVFVPNDKDITGVPPVVVECSGDASANNSEQLTVSKKTVSTSRGTENSSPPSDCDNASGKTTGKFAPLLTDSSNCSSSVSLSSPTSRTCQKPTFSDIAGGRPPKLVPPPWLQEVRNNTNTGKWPSSATRPNASKPPRNTNSNVRSTKSGRSHPRSGSSQSGYNARPREYDANANSRPYGKVKDDRAGGDASGASHYQSNTSQTGAGYRHPHHSHHARSRKGWQESRRK